MLKVVKRYMSESIFEALGNHRAVDVKTEKTDITLYICSADEYVILEDTLGQVFVIPFNENLDKAFLEMYRLKYEDIIEIEIVDE